VGVNTSHNIKTDDSTSCWGSSTSGFSDLNERGEKDQHLIEDQLLRCRFMIVLFLLVVH
jgi:hypothetical protein